MTVISGYLGAGKTTLINQLLAEPHGLRLMVMVNDFGAINIDQALIAAQDDDVLALTNGCICCTMGTDLFLALMKALDRRPRPDHLIIEASGIADPKAIANTALAEPDLRYAGIVTLVDSFNIKDLLDDPYVSPQVQQQISAADLVIQTKNRDALTDVTAALAQHGLPPPTAMPADAVALLMLDAEPTKIDGDAKRHPDYLSWSDRNTRVLDHAALSAALVARPEGLFRLKGIVRTQLGPQEIHIVGNQHEVKPAAAEVQTSIVGIGLRDLITRDAIARWWDAIAPAPAEKMSEQLGSLKS